jgi:hypothetical protein
LSSLDAALEKQKVAIGKLEVNVRDEDKFKKNNASLEASKKQAEVKLQNKKKKVAAAKSEAEVLEWAAEQLNRLEELTPKSAKGKQAKSLAEAVPKGKGNTILARLDDLSKRIKGIVDALD